MGPCRAWLSVQVHVDFSKVFWMHMCIFPRIVVFVTLDHAVNDDMHDVCALKQQLARHALRDKS